MEAPLERSAFFHLSSIQKDSNANTNVNSPTVLMIQGILFCLLHVFVGLRMGSIFCFMYVKKKGIISVEISM